MNLKHNERTLNRPFVFKGIAYDEFMSKEIRVIRHKLIKKYPNNFEYEEEMRHFLKPNGEIGDTLMSKRQDYELPKDYESSSEEESEEEDRSPIRG